MKGFIHKFGLLTILLKILVLPLMGFYVLQLDTTPPVDNKILGFSNTLFNPVVVKKIELNLKLNGTARQTFYDVVPSKYLNGFHYSLDYDRNLPLDLNLVKDAKSGKVDLEILQGSGVKLENTDLKVTIKVVR